MLSKSLEECSDVQLNVLLPVFKVAIPTNYSTIIYRYVQLQNILILNHSFDLQHIRFEDVLPCCS